MSAIRIFQQSGLRNASLLRSSSKRTNKGVSVKSVRNYRREQKRNYNKRAFQTESKFSQWNAVLAAFGLAGAVAMMWDQYEAAEVDYEAVRAAIVELMESNPDYDDGSYGPVFVRLAWHASGTYNKNDGTGGSTGGTIRFSPEADHGANAGLGVAREILEPLIKRFPGISYGDLYTLAGAVAIEQLGGPRIPWAPGRVDGTSADCTPDGRLPDAEKGQDHVRDIFYRMGFNDQEIVALVGAHALGRCHTDRSGYDGPWTASPTFFSNDFFVQLSERTWTKRAWDGPFQYEDESKTLMMLPADVALIQDKEFRKWVKAYAADEDLYFADFAKAFGKLLSLGVKNQ